MVAVICLSQNGEKLVGLGRLLEQLGHGFGRFGQFWLVLARAHVLHSLWGLADNGLTSSELGLLGCRGLGVENELAMLYHRGRSHLLRWRLLIVLFV